MVVPRITLSLPYFFRISKILSSILHSSSDLEKSLKILRKVYGDRHYRICAVCKNMAAIYLKLGDEEKAAEYFKAAENAE